VGAEPLLDQIRSPLLCETRSGSALSTYSDAAHAAPRCRGTGCGIAPILSGGSFDSGAARRGQETCGLLEQRMNISSSQGPDTGLVA